MEAHEPAHPDVSASPVLTGDLVLIDAATGGRTTVDAWLAERMAAEGRERSECLDELANAIARGDVRPAATGS